MTRVGIVVVCVLAAFGGPAMGADKEFPFGLEMTLDVAPMANSKRRPTLEIGDSGEAKLDLWCRSGAGQFSVAGNTVIFVPGTMQTGNCTPVQSQADDTLLASLAEATTWRRQGDTVAFVGSKTVRFRINTN